MSAAKPFTASRTIKATVVVAGLLAAIGTAFLGDEQIVKWLMQNRWAYLVTVGALAGGNFYLRFITGQSIDRWTPKSKPFKGKP